VALVGIEIAVLVDSWAYTCSLMLSSPSQVVDRQELLDLRLAELPFVAE
jgi:hypothetical protein